MNDVTAVRITTPLNVYIVLVLKLRIIFHD